MTVRRSSKLSVPIKRPEDVIPHLGKASHWKEGRSARLLAETWFRTNALPNSVREVLYQIDDLIGAELIDGWLERETDLGDGLGAPTQTDLLALIGLDRQLAVLGIEAKVDESFGPFVSDWLQQGGGRTERLRHLCDLFSLTPAEVQRLRYQLLHRTAAVILEARRFRTDRAVLIVHSFCPRQTGLQDAKVFFDAIGMTGLAGGRMVGTRRFGGVDLSVGWVSDSVSSEHPHHRMEHA